MSRLTRVGRMAAVAAVTATTGLLFTASPAHAQSNTDKTCTAKSGNECTEYTFKSNEFREGWRGKVRGNVTVVLRSDGNWEMDSYAKNNRIAWRNVTFKCTLEYFDPHREFGMGIPRYRVDGGESKRGHQAAYEANVQHDWKDIARSGEVNCSMSLG